MEKEFVGGTKMDFERLMKVQFKYLLTIFLTEIFEIVQNLIFFFGNFNTIQNT
jgi:hypothetical protein